MSTLEDDLDVFVTPPTSPTISRANSYVDHTTDIHLPTKGVIRPSLSRGSRPSAMSALPSLQTNITWKRGIAVERSNLVGNKVTPDTVLVSPTIADGITRQRSTPGSSSSSASSFNSIPLSMDSYFPKRSPCFVHSHLDKGASLQDWLHAKESEALGTNVGVARSLQQPQQRQRHRDDQARFTPVEFPRRDGPNHMLPGTEDDDFQSGSLTRQLAETAVGVREMSKQLGAPFRARSSLLDVHLIQAVHGYVQIFKVSSS